MPLPPPLVDRLALPLVAAPMFLISGPELALACCRQGIVGSFPALNQRTSEGFEAWLIQMNETLAREHRQHPGAVQAPWAVNLVVHRTNPRWQTDLALCVKHRVPIVITSLGAASQVVDAVHGYGGLVFHDVTTLKHARKAAEAGVDGIIAVAAGAGGHAGTLNPFVLAHEIRSVFDGTLLLAGGLSHGEDILAAQALGADLVYMGTRFINTLESQAEDAYRNMIIEAESTDIIHTPAVSGVPASFLRQSLEAAGYPMDKLHQAGEVNYGEKLKPLADEAKAWKTVWSAGQGVSQIHDVLSVADLVSRLSREYRAARARLCQG
ncbi:nitronate monooxygenase family protein [Marinobacter lutaoensis]|uniref:2-nitropropane dioxygenase n=1 Tax=Marinobacter lutaoensis TaxID=135739 RepID=A0A1V2DR47_9GAMM|nr:nitronate monooxygenase family protein [Marinobacter lutaoensis]MBI42403.1 nitronate monooxygenase [Oceanospirillales bacterium]NVD36462.1 nitronate monooxygenase [Marinobacter lutaoensis]ONF43093.1 2-nitropropane dioxygenase [Marinobacter lutaoensis]|tara:strand:+ start:10053 stop:11021 length:969 start_codon:yes stop_codon:yes gene_type:complete